MVEPAELHPEADLDLLRAELDGCQSEIRRLRVENRRLQAELARYRRAMDLLVQELAEGEGPGG